MDNIKILVDDKLVDSDKIGSGNFYWSFPSSNIVKESAKLAQAEKAIQADTQAIAALEAKLKELEAVKTDEAAIARAQAEISTLTREVEDLSKQAAELSETDPELIEQLRQAARACKEGADRWTENVLVLRQWITGKFSGRSMEEVNAMMGIPKDFDYVE